MFKNSFEEMINNFELSNHGAAEVIATKLLQWGNLNVVHRSLVHKVSHPLSKTLYSVNNRHVGFMLSYNTEMTR
jgi:hypothetical protein